MWIFDVTQSPAKILARADAARDAKDWGRASAHYQKFLSLRGGEVSIWIQYGHALKESGQFHAAHAAYSRAISIDPRNSDAHLQFGHLQKITGRFSDAKKSYETAREIDGNVEAIAELRQFSTNADPGMIRQGAEFQDHEDIQIQFRKFSQQIDNILTHVATVKAISFEVARIKKLLPITLSTSRLEMTRATADSLIQQLRELLDEADSVSDILEEVDRIIRRLEMIRKREKNEI